MTKILFFKCEKSEANWLQEEEELYKEKCCLQIKFASLKPYLCHKLMQRWSHRKLVFTPFTMRIATGNLVCSGGILNCMDEERLKQCLENLEGWPGYRYLATER